MSDQTANTAAAGQQVVVMIPDWFLRHVGVIEAGHAQQVDQMQKDLHALQCVEEQLASLRAEHAAAEAAAAARVRELIAEVGSLQRQLRAAKGGALNGASATSDEADGPAPEAPADPAQADHPAG